MIRVFHPPVYQGPRSFLHKSGYFEGWYYKFVGSDDRAAALIPGIALDENRPSAFIQTIETGGATTYTTFDLRELNVSSNPFSVSIGKNVFSLRHVSVGDRIPLSGEVDIIDPSLYPVRLSRPGIMGWYRYMPFMECYHAVLSMDHGLRGSLTGDKGRIDLDRGRGYIEKDWGTSFPSSYIWMQTNSFSESGISFMLSLARIPWFGSWFRGFLGFLRMGDRVITFSTYTGAKIKVDALGDNRVELTVETGEPGFSLLSPRKRGGILKVRASRSGSGSLMAPRSGSMERRIGESLDGLVELSYRVEGKILFRGSSGNSGLEIVGTPAELL